MKDEEVGFFVIPPVPLKGKPSSGSTPIQVILEEPRLKRPQQNAALSGRELAAMMKVGAKVMRGADWKWGDQDGGVLGVGRVIGELGEDGWVRVQWETGSTNSYRYVFRASSSY